MPYEVIGTATINRNITTIRRYDNGMYVIEVNHNVVYTEHSLEDLIEILNNDGIEHIIIIN